MIGGGVQAEEAWAEVADEKDVAEGVALPTLAYPCWNRNVTIEKKCQCRRPFSREGLMSFEGKVLNGVVVPASDSLKNQDKQPRTKKPSMLEYLATLPPGPLLFKTPEDANRHIQEERDSWKLPAPILRLETTILPGHRLEVSSPELPEGAKVEVIVVLPSERKAHFNSALEFLDSLPPGPRAFKTWEQYEQHLQEDRDSWDH